MRRLRVRTARSINRRSIEALSLSVTLIAALACGDVVTTASSDTTRPTDQIRDLVGLGGSHSVARDINDFGRVVGASLVGPLAMHGFSWSELGGIRDLGTLGGPYSDAIAINRQSQVVGWSTTREGVTHAFLLTVGSPMQDLGTPVNGLASEAADIADDGAVVGRWLSTSGETRAFVWTQRNGMSDLAPGVGLTGAEATGINSRGQITGFAVHTMSGARRALVWATSGEARDIGTLGGAESMAFAIDVDGRVVGASKVASGAYHAFLWSADRGMSDLGVLPEMDWSIADGMSDNGYVVGSSGTTDSTVIRAFLWTQQLGMRDAGSLTGIGRQESAAFGVNWYGRAVGYSWNGTTYRPVIFPAP